MKEQLYTFEKHVMNNVNEICTDVQSKLVFACINLQTEQPESSFTAVRIVNVCKNRNELSIQLGF